MSERWQAYIESQRQQTDASCQLFDHATPPSMIASDAIKPDAHVQRSAESDAPVNQKMVGNLCMAASLPVHVAACQFAAARR